MTRTALARIALAAPLAAAGLGCTSQQLYGAGQQWQRTECRRLPVADQDRCLKSTAMSFEEYQRQATAARSGS